MRPSGCKTCSSASAQIPGTPGAIRRLASSSFAVMHFTQTRKTPSTVCPARPDAAHRPDNSPASRSQHLHIVLMWD